MGDIVDCPKCKGHCVEVDNEGNTWGCSHCNGGGVVKKELKVENKEEQQYLDLLQRLIDADPKEDRTGVGTNSIFGHQMRFSLEDGKLPLLTTKKVFFKGVVEELLFFIRAERDTKKLEEKGVKIWTGNTTREFLDKRGLFEYAEGDLGCMYGVQWRDFGGATVKRLEKINDKVHPPFAKQSEEYCNKKFGVDQLHNAFRLIKDNPTSRRIVVSAYNPQESHLGCLEPCHMFFQFNVRGDRLDCLFYMRSNDFFLGNPFNICQYGLLTHMMAKATGLKPGELVFTGGDVHLYRNHIEQAKLQITREPYPFPTLKINKELNSIEDIENLQFEDFDLINYRHHPAIKAKMAI